MVACQILRCGKKLTQEKPKASRSWILIVSFGYANSLNGGTDVDYYDVSNHRMRHKFHEPVAVSGNLCRFSEHMLPTAVQET